MNKLDNKTYLLYYVYEADAMLCYLMVCYCQLKIKLIFLFVLMDECYGI